MLEKVSGGPNPLQSLVFIAKKKRLPLRCKYTMVILSGFYTEASGSHHVGSWGLWIEQQR